MTDYARNAAQPATPAARSETHLVRAARCEGATQTLDEARPPERLDALGLREGSASADRRPFDDELQVRDLFDHSPIPIWIFDLRTEAFVAVNDAAVRTYGYSKEEFARMTVTDIRDAEDAARLQGVLRTASATACDYGTWKHVTRDGARLDVAITAQPLVFRNRPCMLVYAQNVTENRRLEAQFRQAQKMEAVGLLAGGVAHDFNNLLSVILSYAALAMGTLAPDDPVRSDIAEIESAGRRAAELTGQLLAFSRKQVVSPKTIDLNCVLSNMEKMLRRLLGEDIELRLDAEPVLWPVKADPSQIEQIVMNMAVNARDAMPRGGRLTIATRNVEVDETHVRAYPGSRGGPHVVLSIHDDGCGIAENMLSRIFEPFFTTKGPDKGTGLGLATVASIVRQGGGSIAVTSAPGQGTTFRVYFPRIEEARASDDAPRRPAARNGNETILLVEDAPAVRQVVKEILERHGYHVLVAKDPSDAIRLAEDRGAVDLLLTDVVMPRMSGPELASRLGAMHPELKALYMSGYPEHEAMADSGILGERAFIGKPVTPDALLDRVRALLDASGPPTPTSDARVSPSASR